MRAAMMEAIARHAAADHDVIFITGDLGYSVVEPLESSLGERFINAGIAEQNMISLASGLAASGFKPYCYSIAPFVTARCYEQIRNDIAYEGRQVILVGAGAGLSYGSLGPSHHSLEDATIIAALPGMAVLSPANGVELAAVHSTLVQEKRAGYLRVSREAGPQFSVPKFVTLEQGAHVIKAGGDINIVASGPAVSAALEASQSLSECGADAQVISVPVLSPFPAAALDGLLNDGPVMVALEGYAGNPLEQGVRRLLMAGRTTRILFDEVSAPLHFPKTVGSTEALRRALGIDAAEIAQRALKLLAARK